MLQLEVEVRWNDSLFCGRRFRTFNVADDYNREALSIEVDLSLPCVRVVRVLGRIVTWRGYPAKIRMDNGPEFIGKALDRWAYESRVTLDFSRPGKPTDDAFVESFKGSFRDECLNLHWFLSLTDAKEKIELWRDECNTFRPHSSLRNLMPMEFAEQHAKPDGNHSRFFLSATGTENGCGSIAMIT